MVILEEPYVSEVLINYLKTNKIPVLKNHFSEQINQHENRLDLITESDFIKKYKSFRKIYTVSEYALDWVISTLNDKALNKQITLLKNKADFRRALHSLYPDFFFQEITYSDLFTFDVSNLRFPFVIKPAVGFLSAGVYTVFNVEDWQYALAEIKKDFKKQAEKFPDTVVGNDAFILESYIGGKEFAVDIYFRDKEPVIINIFEHPFSSAKDVSDRLYITSKQIFDRYLNVFTEYVNRLNKVLDLDNIPIHIELRVDGDAIYPIEINPLRFTGLCLNEINSYITGKHPLEFYFSNTAPDYETIWKGKEEETFSFSIIEKNLSTNIPFDINSITKIYSDILELRMVKNPRLDIEAFIFSKTHNETELENILNLKV